MAMLRGQKWASLLVNTLGLIPADADQARSLIEPLSIAAFQLYAIEWGPDIRISEWKYPIDLIHGLHTIGPNDNEPWHVLFQRALDIAHKKPLETTL
jgi:hypothetical protein